MGVKLKCAVCNDIIESKSVHDFRPCGCGAIFVDGGDEYTRMGGEAYNILMVDKDDGKWRTLEELRINWN